jgi:hypothetical protein
MKSGPFRRNMIIMTGCVTFILIIMFLIGRHLVRQITENDQNDDYIALRDDFQTAFPRTRQTVNRVKKTILEKTPVLHK